VTELAPALSTILKVGGQHKDEPVLGGISCVHLRV